MHAKADTRRADRYLRFVITESALRYDRGMGTNRFFLVALLTACAMSKPFTPATVPAPPNAFAKTTRVLIERGETIETKDEAAGLIVTKWEDSSAMGSDRRMRWSITIEDGAVTVVSQCSFKLQGAAAPGSENKWEDCGNQPAERSEQAKAIAEAIGK